MDKPTESEIALQTEQAGKPPREWASIVAVALTVALVAVGVLTLAGMMAGIVAVWRPEDGLRVVTLVAGWLLAGIVAAGLCAAAALFIRMHLPLAHQVRSMNQHLAALAQQAFTSPPPVEKNEPNPELIELRKLLADVREILLLPDEQRMARFRTLMQVELRRRLNLVNQYVDAREFHRAREELASLSDRFGINDDIRAAQERLAAATRLALREDIESATRRISDLMTMTRWEHAEQYARELTQKYPDAVEPRQLLERVREERKLFDQRHRQRMHDEIQQFVNQRRWREAAGAADMFIQTFPTGPDTDALRQQLDTLKANAEIEIRQQLERHIKEYIQRKDYWAALELARRIIAEYPFSPQANVLRMQLPRLEELARQQGPQPI
ncbi:MAG TPA: hypothetical protein PL151_01965 [Phycisphaerae bacterium]|nr:hypothetical protein [Phycisphaerae bacterium]HOJ72643.1 hypothetical protein [Phycisphaerae bacterium]HOM49696.1 hypothetical protein [Phycisphaerae bacterium]HON65167.1 hypothetical protein [Phycisphaerae bacterium]HOQ85132.1 hypothetical protein [Phycisphaerae bacterium]